jgi:hypothetical protein
MRRRVLRAAAAAFLLIAAMTAVAGPASASTKAVVGCSSGAVCIYNCPATCTALNPSQIEYRFFSYGAHNVSNLVGDYEVLDNQYGGSNIGDYSCTGSNGTGNVKYAIAPTSGGAQDYSSRFENLTPIYSIVLTNSFSYSKTTY